MNYNKIITRNNKKHREAVRRFWSKVLEEKDRESGAKKESREDKRTLNKNESSEQEKE